MISIFMSGVSVDKWEKIKSLLFKEVYFTSLT